MVEFEAFEGLQPGEGNAVENEELDDSLEHVDDDLGGEDGLEHESGEKEAYTPEELTELLGKDDFHIDTERLSPEGKLLMKSFQKGFTPKLQQRAEALRRVQELESKIQELQKDKETQPPRTIEEAFDRDPDRTLAFFDSEINRLEQIADMDQQAATALPQLKAKQRELVLRSLSNSRREAEEAKLTSAKETTLVKLDARIRRAIPDLHKMIPKLKKFAVEEMGYDPEELGKLTNPAIAGESAVHNTITIYRAYKALKPDELKDKTRRPEPPDLEGAGAGFQQKASRSSLKKAREVVKKNPTVENMTALLGEKRRSRKK